MNKYINQLKKIGLKNVLFNVFSGVMAILGSVGGMALIFRGLVIDSSFKIFAVGYGMLIVGVLFFPIYLASLDEMKE